MAKRPVILVSHGYRQDSARQAIERLHGRLHTALSHVQLNCAYVDIEEPGLQRSVENALATRQTSPATDPIIVLPLFLGRGFHFDHDIAGLIERRKWSSAEVKLLDPVGPAEYLTDVLLAATAKTSFAAAILAGAGSSSARATADHREQAQLLAGQSGKPIYSAQLSTNEQSRLPPLETTLQYAVDRHGPESVVVLSWLLTPGHFYQLLVEAVKPVGVTVTAPIVELPGFTTHLTRLITREISSRPDCH